MVSVSGIANADAYHIPPKGEYQGFPLALLRPDMSVLVLAGSSFTQIPTSSISCASPSSSAASLANRLDSTSPIT